MNKSRDLFLACLMLVGVLVSASCKKTRQTTGDPPVTPPVVTDTISYVGRIEEDYLQGNPNITRRNRDYSFTYDSRNRVIRVGIKNYSLVLFDTATCFLEYIGNANKPYRVITPNIHMSSIGQPVYYDTTFFRYDQNDRIISDSALQPVYDFSTTSYIKRPLRRSYSYPTQNLTVIDWYATYTNGGALSIYRRDSLDHSSSNDVNRLKTQYYGDGMVRDNYALCESFTYSGYVNPLSKLNISGTVFSVIYTSVFREILGNEYHKAVHNSNILPYFLDFYSARVPTQFYLGGFTPSGFLISAQYDGFDVQITPWSQRTSYPSRISVGASTALGDRFIYRYYYR